MHGEVIKDFVLVAPLRKGGMGEVWRAEQRLVKTQVAIKLLLPQLSAEKAGVERFFNEAIAVGRVQHAGVVKIFDVGFHGDRAYLVMELLDGETLATRIQRLARLPLAQVAELGRQIASVLEATRATGIVHRDLKPDNIFIVKDAELPCGERAKLLDFGIAKLGVGVTGLTGANDSMGTPPYMAPELWKDAARADARADTYSFGCLVFEMLTGRTPFVAGTIGEYCTQHLTFEPPRASSLVETPPQLDDLIARMLAKEPRERPSISELRAAFDALAAGASFERVSLATPIPVAPPTIDERGGAPRAERTTLGSAARQVSDPEPAARARTGVFLGIAGVAAVGGGIAIYAATRSEQVKTEEPPHLEKAASRPAAAAVERALREPKVGLDAIAAYADPTPARLADLRSIAMWRAAHDDLADACTHPKAPVRWCAAADFAEAQARLADGAVEPAIVLLRGAAKRDDAWALPHVALASALLEDRRGANPTEALAEATTAQRLDPASWQSIAAAARAFAAGGKPDDAMQEYRRALALAPKNAVLLAEVAMALHATGYDAEARRYADEALAIDGRIAIVHVMRAELALEKNDGKTAVAEAELAIADAPKTAAAHLAHGDGLALRGDDKGAMAAYRKALELNAERYLGAPVARMKLVEDAVAKNRIPPPRHPIATRPAATGAPDRTHVRDPSGCGTCLEPGGM